MLDLKNERDHAVHIMKINITPELKATLELRHSKVHDGRDRIKAVLLRSEGWKIVMIAQALRIDESTITRYLKDFANNQNLILKMVVRELFEYSSNRTTYCAFDRDYL